MWQLPEGVSVVVCGCSQWGYCGRCNPLPVFTGLEGESEWVCECNERSGTGSCLLWSVGTFDVVSVWAWAFWAVADVVCLISEVGVAALCGCL